MLTVSSFVKAVLCALALQRRSCWGVISGGQRAAACQLTVICWRTAQVCPQLQRWLVSIHMHVVHTDDSCCLWSLWTKAVMFRLHCLKWCRRLWPATIMHAIIHIMHEHLSFCKSLPYTVVWIISLSTFTLHSCTQRSSIKVNLIMHNYVFIAFFFCEVILNF